eukprot:comp10169_c0_seq1/m.12130 comp10169_c0_seq1/g.12130  ORF comp10169_c0_seq1/g.12130 comp10169_c0_seq1/m.12130 type:complete len:205 (+) comp10169_c0_seq1:50-664(+)
MSILEYNGAAVCAMAGKNCVAIASDRRYGIQAQTVATDFQKVFRVHDRLFVGLPGLASDMQTVARDFRMRTNLYQLKEDRAIEPRAFSGMVSAALYERRFGPWFVEPVIAGLDKDDKPYLCAMDLLGAGATTEDFVVAGTSTEQLYGACEAFFKPDMSPEQLFETISQAILAATDRDCTAGWGAVVHVITPTQVISKVLKGRMD